MIKAKEFLDTIFDELPEDEYICVSRAIPKKDGKGVWFNNYLLTARQWRKWSPEKQDQAWYMCVSTVNGELNDKGSMVGRGRQHLKAAYCLVLDDIGSKADPPPVAPAWKLESSKGNFQYGFIIERTTEWGKYEALLEYCHQQGWGDAGAGGSYRLVRLPGSANLKPGRQGWHSVVEDWGELEVWPLDELAEALGCDFNKIEVRPDTPTLKTAGAEAREGIDPMLDWLSDAGHIIKDDGGVWVDISCPWADAHTTGEGTAGYSPLGRGSGEYIQTRAFRCLHEHCTDKRLTDLIKWGHDDGAPFVSGYDPLPWLQSKFAYVQMGQMVVDLEQRKIGGEWRWSFADWSAAYPGKVRTPGRDNPVAVGTAFRESSNTQTAVNMKYVPVRRGGDTGVVMKHGQELINLYVSPNWDAVNEEPTIFLEHMDYLIPDVHARELFLNWLAHKVQNPMLRSWAVLMIADGVFGTGRSWLKLLIDKMMQGHVNPVSIGQLIGKGTASEQNYNDWQVGSLFLVCDEVKDASISKEDFWNGYETFKVNVDISVNENMRINTKYGAIRNEDAYYNVLMFSNHADALALPPEERRIYVIENPDKRREPAYYERLTGCLKEGEPQRVYWWLMRRDVTGFDHVYPEDTPAKLAMIETTRAPSDRIYDWMVEHYGSDLVTKASLRNAVRPAARDLDYEKVLREPSDAVRRIWDKLKSLRPDDKNGARYMVNGKQMEVRALRNRSNWQLTDADRSKKTIEEELAKVEFAEKIL